jgi:hypothetical protein
MANQYQKRRGEGVEVSFWLTLGDLTPTLRLLPDC